MRLFIAEKPSMAAEIAKCLAGPLRRREGCIVTGDGVVTWAFGHILRQAEPDEYDGKYKIWRAEDLPIIPAQWRMVIAESSRRQFDIVTELIGQATEIVHAGDPDREGQLLIDEVLDFVDNKKPVYRILINALDLLTETTFTGVVPNVIGLAMSFEFKGRGFLPSHISYIYVYYPSLITKLL